MSSAKKTSGIRRKDYVAHIAIALFVFIIVFEILLVTWLPSQLITRNLWNRDVALQELITLEDKLRNNIGKSMKFDDNWQKGEAHMSLSCLNNIAKYLRKHQPEMSIDQIKELYEILKQFENRSNQWKHKKFSISFESIDINPLMKEALEKYKNEKHKKQQPEKKDILFQD